MQDVVEPPVASGGGFEKVSVRQFTVFLPNRVGKLAWLLGCLGDSGLRLSALAVEESADAALVRLIACDTEACRACLNMERAAYSETDVLAVEVPRTERQPLIGLVNALLSAEVSIHYAYPLLRPRDKPPAMAFYVEDIVLASRLLMRRDFRILGESDLAEKGGYDNA